MTSMSAIRSILWIGPAEGLARTGVAEVPSLDITWASDADEALSLPPTGFDAAVLDGEEPESLLTALRRLKRVREFSRLRKTCGVASRLTVGSRNRPLSAGAVLIILG